MVQMKFTLTQSQTTMHLDMIHLAWYVAHLSQHFFGPEWQLTTSVHLAGQPCYGPPAHHGQADLLPELFTPQPPPLYHGTPCPPYIEGPPIFDLHIFAALSIWLPCIRDIDPSRATCYKKIHGMEVMNVGACMHNFSWATLVKLNVSVSYGY